MEIDTEPGRHIRLLSCLTLAEMSPLNTVKKNEDLMVQSQLVSSHIILSVEMPILNEYLVKNLILYSQRINILDEPFI